MKKERLETLSDGVIAIVLTLMILEIKLPALDRSNILLLGKQLLIYAVSFIIIAITWINYNSYFKLVEKINPKIIWLNLGMLFMLSLVPLPTKAIGESFYNRDSHLLFAIILSATSLLYTLLQMEANKFITDLSEKEKHYFNKKNWIATGLFTLAIPLCFISVYCSSFIFLLLPSLYFIPSKVVSA